MTSLRITGLGASHGGVPVLHGLALDVPSGTTTAVLGPSGCGKSTLLRVVAGFQGADTGAVVVGGRTVAAPGTWVPPERRGVGYVAQEGNLFPHLSVGANIAFGLPRRQRRDRAGVERLLELVGLPRDLRDRRPDQLSGGQQQRVALARALARRPRVVLLDEPFSSLDAGLRTSTRQAVADALAHEEATVVLVTHDQSEALSFADQVAIMADGRFRQVGTPDEVYRAPVDQRCAQFLGEAVFLRGEAQPDGVRCALGTVPAHGPAAYGPAACGAVELMLRPEQVVLTAADGTRPCAEVLSTTYFGHDALVALRLLDATGTVLSSRVPGADAPPAGSRVGLAVSGEGRVFAG